MLRLPGGIPRLFVASDLALRYAVAPKRFADIAEVEVERRDEQHADDNSRVAAAILRGGFEHARRQPEERNHHEDDNPCASTEPAGQQQQVRNDSPGERRIVYVAVQEEQPAQDDLDGEHDEPDAHVLLRTLCLLLGCGLRRGIDARGPEGVEGAVALLLLLRRRKR